MYIDSGDMILWFYQLWKNQRFPSPVKVTFKEEALLPATLSIILFTTSLSQNRCAPCRFPLKSIVRLPLSPFLAVFVKLTLTNVSG